MSTQIRGNKQIKNITIQNEQLANGTIELDKLKDGAELLKRDGSVAATGDFDLGSNQLKNIGAPVDANDAVRKADLDAVTNGLSVFRETPSGSINGTNTQFSLQNEPNLGTEQVFLNGALMNSGANSDYVLEGSTITFTIAPQSGDVVLVNYVTDAVVVSLDINTTVNQLNSRLTTAEGELFTAQGDITSVEGDIVGLDSRLTSAEAGIVAVEGDVSLLDASLTSVQGSVSSLQSDLADEEAARIAADDALDTTVGSIQTSVTSLGNRMTTAEGDITALEAADAAFDLRAGVIEDGLQAETSARTSADSALSSRVTALENAPEPVAALSELSDVTITSPSADQILKYNGTGWVNDAAPATFSGSYNDLSDKPSLFSGSYNDLSDTPTIPSALDDLSDVAVSSAAKGQFIVHNGTSFVNSNTIEASDAAVKPLIVKGAASQTANLFEVQNSSSTVLALVTSTGRLGINTASPGAMAQITCSSAATTGIILKAAASQTANVFEMHTSAGGIPFGITASGKLAGSSMEYTSGTETVWTYKSPDNGFGVGQLIISRTQGFPSYWTFDRNNAGFNFKTNNAAQGGVGINLTSVPTASLHVLNNFAAKVGILLKGAASQSANHFEIQNSAGTAIFSIDKDGSVDAGTVPVARVSGLAAVATSGDYADLSNAPTVYTPVKEVLTSLVDGTETEFVLADTPNASAYVQVFLNGLLQSEGASEDYTISGSTVTFNTAPEAGWKLVVFYFV